MVAQAIFDSRFAISDSAPAGAQEGGVMSYAQLVGIAAVFGNQPMTVELTPANQDILPGFQANLLDGPAEDPFDAFYADEDEDEDDGEGDE